MLHGQSHRIYVLLLLQSPNLSQFCSKARCFRVSGNFDTSALNDPKMTLEH